MKSIRTDHRMHAICIQSLTAEPQCRGLSLTLPQLTTRSIELMSIDGHSIGGGRLHELAFKSRT
jgi:hypothetical protein